MNNNPEIKLDRQTNYVIVISPENEKDAISKSVKIAEEYIKKTSQPKVVILSDNYKNKNLKRIAFSQVQTFKKGTIRVVDKNNESRNYEILKKMSSLLKNSMIVIDENIVFDNECAKLLLSKNNRAQDYIIHRNTIELLNSEIDHITKEYENMAKHEGNEVYKPSKNIILRLHDYPQFPIDKETLIALNEVFGRTHASRILLSYFVARKKTIKFAKVLNEICKDDGESFVDYINPHEFKRQARNYTYYNLITGQILEPDTNFLRQCGEELKDLLMKTEE